MGVKRMPYQRDEEGGMGFRIEDEIVCPDCIEEEELEEMTKSNLLTEMTLRMRFIAIDARGSCNPLHDRKGNYREGVT